jgi:putative ABC transport system permease protein
MATAKTVAFVLSAFAAIALALAIGGIYAVLSYVVGRRRHEIGIRLALGAESAQVQRLVVRQGLMLVVVGLVIGVPTALVASRALGSLLVGVSSSDPETYLGVIVVLLVTGGIAAFIPAKKASGVEPKIALSEGG